MEGAPFTDMKDLEKRNSDTLERQTVWLSVAQALCLHWKPAVNTVTMLTEADAI